MPFSVVLPIHNEERNLVYSLPSVLKLKLDELIMLFDRCTDSSVETAHKMVEKYGMTRKTVFVVVNQHSDWKNRHAFVARIGYSMARNNLVFVTAADIILDPAITNYFPLVATSNIAFISFLHIDYPISFRNLLKRLLVGFGVVPPTHKERWLAGPYVFSKKAWLETEDQDSVKQLTRAHDTHLHKAILTKYTSRCIKTRTVHLRPRESKAMHYWRGQLYWNVAKRSFLLTLLSALFYLRLDLIKGYIHARIGKNERTRSCMHAKLRAKPKPKVLCVIPALGEDLLNNKFVPLIGVLRQHLPVDMIVLLPKKSCTPFLPQRMSEILNEGLSHIKLEDFDYILRCDSDVFLPSTYLEENLKGSPDLVGSSANGMILKVTAFVNAMKGKFMNENDDAYTRAKLASLGFNCVRKPKIPRVLTRKSGLNYPTRTQLEIGKQLFKLGYEPFHALHLCITIRKIKMFIGYLLALFTNGKKWDVASYIFHYQVHQLMRRLRI